LSSPHSTTPSLFSTRSSAFNLTKPKSPKKEKGALRKREKKREKEKKNMIKKK
jgi:hypothetical protein